MTVPRCCFLSTTDDPSLGACTGVAEIVIRDERGETYACRSHAGYLIDVRSVAVAWALPLYVDQPAPEDR